MNARPDRYTEFARLQRANGAARPSWPRRSLPRGSCAVTAERHFRR